jgi:hypothetical protein
VVHRAGIRLGRAQALKVTKEFRGDGFLSFRGIVDVVDRRKEGGYRREEPGAVRDVKGARLETVPKRLSQMACGSPDRRSRQGLLESVHDPGFGAESKPASPGPVFVLVRLRLNRFMDDSAVRSTSSAKDKISLGSG